MMAQGNAMDEFRPPDQSDEVWNAMMQGDIAGQQAVREVNLAASIGSSMVIPALAFLLATVIFLRRDF